MRRLLLTLLRWLVSALQTLIALFSGGRSAIDVDYGGGSAALNTVTFRVFSDTPLPDDAFMLIEENGSRAAYLEYIPLDAEEPVVVLEVGLDILAGIEVDVSIVDAQLNSISTIPAIEAAIPSKPQATMAAFT